MFDHAQAVRASRIVAKLKSTAAAASGPLRRATPVQKFSPSLLDDEYVLGRWDYLENASEMARYAVISGYCAASRAPVSVLDLGCGTGVLRRCLRTDLLTDYVGVDLSQVAIERARHESQGVGRFVTADISLYRPDDLFDLIVLNEVLYYFSDPSRLIRRYARSLKSDGAFVVSLWESPDSRAAWRRAAPALDVVDMVEVRNKAGLTWRIRLCRPI